MTTIKERAKEYAHKYHRDTQDLSGESADAAYAGFLAGAKSEREELLRWRDPKEELPDYYHSVLIKYLKDGLYTYAVVWLSVGDDDKYLWTIAETNMLISDRSVHSWRPIVELP